MEQPREDLIEKAIRASGTNGIKASVLVRRFGGTRGADAVLQVLEKMPIRIEDRNGEARVWLSGRPTRGIKSHHRREWSPPIAARSIFDVAAGIGVDTITKKEVKHEHLHP